MQCYERGNVPEGSCQICEVHDALLLCMFALAKHHLGRCLQNAFALFAADPAIDQYPGETTHTYSACTTGTGMGFATDPYDSTKMYPLCRLTWGFPKGVANFKMRVGVVMWKTLADTEDPSPGEQAAYRVEIFYRDVTSVSQTLPPEISFINEDADAYKK
eukprot:scaffold289845_cov34-Prasinocladus_malaysianus.AAC.1